MKRDYKELLDAGNKAQLKKLEENEHKNGFDDIHPDYAARRIKGEFIELEEAKNILAISERFNLDKDVRITLIENYRDEFADIANFAHMGILACDKEIRRQK